MWPRYLIAFVGASAITVAMFLGMSEVSKLFNERDPTRYFEIFDVLPRQSGPPRVRFEPVPAPPRPRLDPLPVEPTSRIEVRPSFEGAAPEPLETRSFEVPSRTPEDEDAP